MLQDFNLTRRNSKGQILETICFRQIDEELITGTHSAFITLSNSTVKDLSVGYLFKESKRGWTFKQSNLYGQQINIFLPRNTWHKELIED